MIKKVPGIYAFVLKDTDFDILEKTTHLSEWFCKRLPIFDLSLPFIDEIRYSNDGSYYVVLNQVSADKTVSAVSSALGFELNAKYVDIINQTWDQMFDDGY